MKTIRKRKQMYASYKGWHVVQIPWQPWDREFQTAKWIFNPEGKLAMRVSYGGKALNHKQLRLYLMTSIKLIKHLTKDLKCNSQSKED